jgi:putative aldouronate transport system permease protein
VSIAKQGAIALADEDIDVVRPRGIRIKESGVDRAFLVVVYLLLIVLLAVVLLPLMYIVASSFSSPGAVSSGRVSLWPVEFSVRGYQVAFRDPQIVRGFLNSIFYTFAGTAVSVTLTIAMAFPLSRTNLFGRGVITKLVVFTMLFTGGLIPTFMIVRSLGMLDTPWALLIPQSIGVWQVLIASTYFREAIPEELYDAARLDGAGDISFLFQIAIPLAKPMIAVIALMYAIQQWNSYFDALIYLRTDDLYPLQLVLRNILILNQASTGQDAASMVERQQLADLLKYSLIVISTAPVLLIYPLVAKHFTKGIMLGAVKG